MVNIRYCMVTSRRESKTGDWKRAVQILSAALCVDIKCRAKLLIERARVNNMHEQYTSSLLDSRKIMDVEPTNYRGYNHAAIAAYGSSQYEEALVYIHTGLEKVTDHLPLIVRLGILLELEDYKDLVQQVSGAETKDMLQAFIAEEGNEFLNLLEALEKKSDEVFAIFRAVALSVVGKLDKGQEVVEKAELSHPNRPSLIAAKQFLQNAEALVAAMRNDVHFEADETPSDLDVEKDDLYSDPEPEEDSAGEEEETSDSDVSSSEGDDEEVNEELVGLVENGGGDQQPEERNDSGLGGDNELVSSEEAMEVSAFDARCKVASEKMLNGDYRGAYERYRSAELHVAADVGADVNDEFAVFRFCLTYSKLQVQTTDVAAVQDCIETFQELSLAFPDCGVGLLGHIGTWEAKRKLNIVKDYQQLLDEGKEMLASYDFKPVTYPGMDDVIVGSTAGGFKQYLDAWAELVKHRPEHVAKCMHTPCGGIKPEIYESDMDFKGYVELKCTKRCILQFHQSCWKQELKSKANASDTLGAQCWTPDCEGILVVFKVIDEKNEVSVQRSKEEVTEKKKSKKQPKSHHLQQQQQQQKKTEQKKTEEAAKKGKKERKKSRGGEDHSSDEENEEPEKPVGPEQEAKGASKSKEDSPQQQPLQSKEQKQSSPSGATAIPNPGEVPWESMKRVKRSDDEEEKKEEQARGGKKEKKKKKGKQRAAVNPQHSIRIEFTLPKRQLLSADGEVRGRGQQEGAQAGAASARAAIAGSTPSPPPPPPLNYSRGFPSLGETPLPERPREASKLVNDLAVLIKLVMDHMRANGPTPLATLDKFVSDCDHEVQVHIANKGGLKSYLSRAIAAEFYDGYAALPGDRKRVKQTFTTSWKTSNVLKYHLMDSLEEGPAHVAYDSDVRSESPYEEIADEEEDSEEEEEEPDMLVAQTGKESGANGNVESVVNAALNETKQEVIEEQAAADRSHVKLLEQKKDETFQELLNERLGTLKLLNEQLDQAKGKRTRFLEQKASQEQEIKKLEYLYKGKTDEFKRTLQAWEARVHQNKETAAAYASELLAVQADVIELERNLKQAEKNRFFSDGEELTVERARRRLGITRGLEEQLNQDLANKAEFLRHQANLLVDIQEGARDERESLSKAMCSALAADAKNLVSRVEDMENVSAILNVGPARKETFNAELEKSRIRAKEVSKRVAEDVKAVEEAVRVGREPELPRVRAERGCSPLTTSLEKLQLKGQKQEGGQQLWQGEYPGGIGPASPLPKTSGEFLNFVQPKNASALMAPPGFDDALLQQEGVRPVPGDPAIAAFPPFVAANPALADPTMASMRPVATAVPAYNFNGSGAVGGAAFDLNAQWQQQLQAQHMQALADFQQQQQQQQQQFMQAAFLAQFVDPTSATLTMAASEISALCASAGGVVSTGAAPQGQGVQVQASAVGGGAISSKLMEKIVVALVTETGLAQDVVVGALHDAKARRGKLSGLTQDELRAIVLDILVEQGHKKVFQGMGQP